MVGKFQRHESTELAHSFLKKNNSVLVSVSVFMALSTVFHSMNSPDNSSGPNSALLLLSTIYLSL